MNQNEFIKTIPEFQDGLIIESTGNYNLVYGYKPEMQGQKEGQRIYLVPTGRQAEQELVDFAEKNFNALTEMPFGANAEDLLKCLHSDEGIPPGPLGSGIPSSNQLEAKLGKVG